MKDKRVLIGLSGGINSMAVLIHLVQSGQKPKELHLFYAHFKEHSPDTEPFVDAGIAYAKANFENVHVTKKYNSIIEWFGSNNMIPHPMVSPCSRKLKIEPINEYAEHYKIDVDLVGYVKHELIRRVSRQKASNNTLLKEYPIGEFTDEWCFEITKKHIGWYPKIYDIKWTEQDYLDGICRKNEIGKRVFKHNNCLPCKNMTIKELEAVKRHYPEYYDEAMKLTDKIKRYWGRDEAMFYSTFGRDLGQESTCETCKF